MKKSKSLPYLLLALISLAGGVSILIFFPRHPFIRGTLGDVLVMLFLYGLAKLFFQKIRDLILILSLFIFALCLEIAQATGIFQVLKTHLPWGAVITGTTFDWGDTLAYLTGTLLNLLFHHWFSSKTA